MSDTRLEERRAGRCRTIAPRPPPLTTHHPPPTTHHSPLIALLAPPAPTLPGATFVPCQFWNSQLFVKEVAGAAQAIAGGWGNLGGGVTQVVMPLVYTACLTGMSEYNAWRYSFIVPGSAALICGVCMLRFSDDTPKGNISELVKANAIQKKSATSSAREGFGEVVTWVLALQYGCCFGVELTVNNMMADYFTTRFELDLVAAGTIAGLFGLMNIFARAIGGFLSDKMNKKCVRLTLTLILILILILTLTPDKMNRTSVRGIVNHCRHHHHHHCHR